MLKSPAAWKHGIEKTLPKIKYTAEKGLVQETGSGVEFQTDSLSFNAMPFSPVQAISTAATVTAPGVYTIAGGSPTAIVMPLAATHPGATFVFRSASAQAHYLTGSAETVGTPVFVGQQGALPAGVGSKLTFAATSGTSVVIVSDGSRFCVTAGSGSITLTESLPA